jgi:heme/copper-type cytochrome/quinol oxidase subunit 3
MSTRAVIDVSELPDYAFGHRHTLWWGVMGLIAIEGTMFAICIAVYFYLRLNAAQWPPFRTAPPSLLFPTLNTVLLLATLIPSITIDRLAKRGISQSTALMLVTIMVVMIAGSLVIRWQDFHALNCKWNDHAYGSIVWMTLALHAGHLIASGLEWLTFLAYLLRYEIDNQHRVDLHVNSVYWYFVVFSWIPLYAMLCFAPRLL